MGNRGGLAVHVAVTVTTLAAVAVLVVFLVRHQQHSQQEHRRKALRICEDGLIVALERLQQEPSWREGIARTEHRDGWYAVAVSSASGDPPGLEVVAQGHSGGVERRQLCTLRLVVDKGDSMWVQEQLREE